MTRRDLSGPKLPAEAMTLTEAGGAALGNQGEKLNNKYVIEGRLGSGGMAEVYLARTVGARGFQRRVAIKRILSGHAEDARYLEMFVGEATITARLQHANIVSVLDFDRDDRGNFFS